MKAVPSSANVSLLDLIRKQPNYQKTIGISRLCQRSGRSPSSIASVLNGGNAKPFRGGDKWVAEDLIDLFEEVDDTTLTKLEVELPRENKRFVRLMSTLVGASDKA